MRNVKHFSDVYSHLRRKNWRQYALLAGCAFFSVLLITAYACMMRSPTILTILPEGGDSRKQVMMIFVLAVLGCAVFTIYASGLFFRQKSREIGTFLALGATRNQLRTELTKELAILSVVSCGLGAPLGAPLSWLIWQVFRVMVVDTEEMSLTFDAQAFLIPLVFSLFIIFSLFFMGARSIRRTNIIDIVQESHKSEPIRAVPRWYGPVGILLLAAGLVLGYSMPSVLITQLQWYPPDGLTAVFYLPALVGLYLILLHTVVNGWGGKRRKYKDLISTSMMKFQGRQTVRNMLVMTVLLAGAYFASFYLPMLLTSSGQSIASRPTDFLYHYRMDQNMVTKDDVQQMAQAHNVDITAWSEVTGSVLGIDGIVSLETDAAVGTTYTQEYRQLTSSATMLSESDFNAMTGRNLQLEPGTGANILDDDGGSSWLSAGDVTHITNTVTGLELDIEPVEPVRYSQLIGCFILDDSDYAQITQGLTALWQEHYVLFNVADVESSYPFAKELFYAIVDHSGPEVEVFDAWDPVERELALQEDGTYIFDPEHLEENGLSTIDYEKPDSTEFRLNWKYMPQFKILDQTEAVKTMAVFLMLFAFIAIVCFAAFVVISFTRCMTIGLTNARIYEDLRHLGAPRSYLYRSVRGQVSRVFLVPTLVGTSLIYAFYALILYFNGDPAGITPSESTGMLACLALIAVVSVIILLIYRLTLKKVCKVTIDQKAA